MDSGPVAPLIVIVGPTASGKTALAVELAEKYGGEIICADSRTIYKDMDIGTAKPSREEQSRVPHWGIDLVYPNQSFSVVDFQRYAQAKIKDIRERGRVPFLVGGTGLYVDSVLFGYQFTEKPDIKWRAYLESLSLQSLHEYCKENNISLPENLRNRRYVIRAIERNGQTLKRRDSPIDNCIIVGIVTYKEILQQRIVVRSEHIFSNNVVDEAIILGKKYGWDHESMKGNIYPLVHSLAEGQSSLESIREEFIRLDWKLAKRQLTWFRRNPYIVWLQAGEVVSYITPKLAAR